MVMRTGQGVCRMFCRWKLCGSIAAATAAVLLLLLLLLPLTGWVGMTGYRVWRLKVSGRGVGGRGEGVEGVGVAWCEVAVVGLVRRIVMRS
jgi:hypothetical protein